MIAERWKKVESIKKHLIFNSNGKLLYVKLGKYKKNYADLIIAPRALSKMMYF